MSTTDAVAMTQLSATEIASRIARGELSAVEVAEAHIARIEQVNPLINAVVANRYDAARTEAQAADERRTRGEPLGPLHGVPITVKESLDVTGLPSTFGLPSRANILAERDDPYVTRLRAAGAIILGKTNVPQMLFYSETDNPLYGRTNNPWNLDRTPGGSSGGEAAIIATGGSPLGLGTDWGGSIRTPASFCGLAGIMPTAGRCPDFGRYSLPPGQRAIACQVGVMARCVADVALGLEIINGGRNPAVEPPQPLGDSAAMDISQLRVAYYTDDGTFPIAASVRRAVVEAAGMLAGQGAQVVEWRPPDAQHALDLFSGILSADGARSYKEILKKDPRDPRIGSLVALAGQPRPALALIRGLLRLLGQRYTASVVRSFGHNDTAHYWQLVEAQIAYQQRFQQALDTDDGGPFDVIICPAWALPAIPHGASARLLTAGAYAPLYNVLGYPTGIVRATHVRPGEELPRRRSRDAVQRAARSTEVGSAGLPIGVQVVARPWREHVALAAMRAIEDAVSAQGYPAVATQ